jgi:hypothetical protein
VRGSETDRALICPASLVLPRVTRDRSAKTMGAANFGTLVHHWKETGQTDPPWADPSHVATLERKILLSGIDRLAFWDGGQHEATFALNLFTEEVREYDGPREGADEWKKGFAEDPQWLTGSIDYIFDDGSIDDLKTGSWPVEPKVAGQLGSYALLPWIKAGKPLDWKCVLSITAWPKYPLAALPVVSKVVASGFELMEHLDALKYAVEHPYDAVPSEEGCRWCDCKPLCPAWVDDTVDIGAL